jgi:hypothetical protein
MPCGARCERRPVPAREGGPSGPAERPVWSCPDGASVGGNTVTAGLDPEMLRALVREALADLLPPAPGQAGPPAGPVPAPPGPGGTAPGQEGAVFTVRDGVGAVETVSVRTDQELAAFVTRLLHLFENPRRRDDLRSGRLRFRLTAAGAAGSARPTRRIDKGAVTEAAVRDAARAGARLVLGRRAVLTPLARDRARAAGVEIEKER